MSYGNSDGSDGSSSGGYGGDSSSSSTGGGYGGDSSSSSSGGGYGGDSSSSSSGGGYGGDSSTSSSSGGYGGDCSSSSSSGSSNDDSNSSSSGVDSTSDNSDHSDSGSNSDSSNVNSDSSAAAESDSSIDSSPSLAGAQLDGSAGNSLNPSEGIVGGTPCSDDIGSNYNDTYSGISLDGTAGAALASSEPAAAYSFSGYISDNYDSTVASSYQSTLDMSGFQNTEVTEPSLLGSAWNSVAQWADQNVVQPLQGVYNDYVAQPLNNVETAIGNIYNDNVEPTINNIEKATSDIYNGYVTQPLDNIMTEIGNIFDTPGSLEALQNENISQGPNNITSWMSDKTPPISERVPSSSDIFTMAGSTLIGATIEEVGQKEKPVMAFVKDNEIQALAPKGSILSSQPYKEVAKGAGTTFTVGSYALDVANTWSEDDSNTNLQRLEKTGIQTLGTIATVGVGALTTALAPVSFGLSIPLGLIAGYATSKVVDSLQNRAFDSLDIKHSE